MKIFRQGVVGAVALAAMTLLGAAGAQAAAVQCGDAALGVRIVTVDPAKVGGLCYAGLTNLGDGALVTLLNGLIAPDTSVLIDRDNADSNGGDLNITGEGGTSGTWSFTSTLWDDYTRMFLYFHFGDARDCSAEDCTGFPTDPDIFIVELTAPSVSGTWSWNGVQGLSNIALLGVEGDGGDPDGDPTIVPLPGTLLLLGLGLLGLGYSRRRTQ